MAAEKGNQYAKKLNTPELKKLAYEDYCSHISKGFPHKAWCWRHEGMTLTWNSIEKYIREEPQDFDPIHKEAAEAESLKIWIKDGIDMMHSETKCQPAIYQMMMRNIHKWDKETTEEKLDREKAEKTQTLELLEEIRAQRKGL